MSCINWLKRDVWQDLRTAKGIRQGVSCKHLKLNFNFGFIWNPHLVEKKGELAPYTTSPCLFHIKKRSLWGFLLERRKKNSQGPFCVNSKWLDWHLRDLSPLVFYSPCFVVAPHCQWCPSVGQSNTQCVSSLCFFLHNQSPYKSLLKNIHMLLT